MCCVVPTLAGVPAAVSAAGAAGLAAVDVHVLGVGSALAAVSPGAAVHAVVVTPSKQTEIVAGWLDSSFCIQ